jgi:hypothetical protein
VGSRATAIGELAVALVEGLAIILIGIAIAAVEQRTRVN